MPDKARRKPTWSSLTRLERLALLSSVLIWAGVIVFAIGLFVALRNHQSQRLAYADMAVTTPPAVERAAATPTAIETTVVTPTSPLFPAGWSTATPTPPRPSSPLGTARPARATVTTSPTAQSAPEKTEDRPTSTSTSAQNALLPADPPDRLVIPAIKLDSPVVPIGWQVVERDGQTTRVWQVADDVAGWHETSAYPGHPGNVVLNGHHNIKGEVFRYLIDLEVGDRVWVYAKDEVYTYTVVEKHILKELGEPLEVRRQNAQWMNPTEDERLTMITCWPYTNNTHRLIVVAKPAPPLTTEDSEGQNAP